jgi:hypothetical protein
MSDPIISDPYTLSGIKDESSLNIINQALAGQYFDYCKNLASLIKLAAWNSGSSVETDLEKIRLKAETDNRETLPALIITRTDLDSDVLGARANDYKYRAYGRDTVSGKLDKHFDYRVVNILYKATFRTAEYILENLVIFNDPANKFEYNIPWLGTDGTNFEANWQNKEPKVSQVFSNNRTEGFLYLVSQDINVIATLVSSVKATKLIHTAMANIIDYDSLKELETIVVNQEKWYVTAQP